MAGHNLLWLTSPRIEGATRPALRWVRLGLAATDAGDGKLIHEHEVLPSGGTAFLLPADGAEHEAGFLRYADTRRLGVGRGTGVLRTAAVQRRISVSWLDEILTPLTCPTVGEAQTVLNLDLVDPDAGNWRIESDNGTVNGFYVTPARLGRMTLTLVIDSPVTRRPGSLKPVKTELRRLPLGTYRVTDGRGCMIRMELDDPAGGFVATWNPDGDYTEYRGRDDDARIYISQTDLAMFDPARGWLPEPEEVRLQMLSRYMGMQAMLDLIPRDAERAIVERGERAGRHLPTAMVEAFSVANLARVSPATLEAARAAGAGGAGTAEPDPVAALDLRRAQDRALAAAARQMRAGFDRRERRASCPDGSSGCRRVDFGMPGLGSIAVVAGLHGRPLEVGMPGMTAPFRFAYGDFPIARPPGW